jgi:hypothetical protein
LRGLLPRVTPVCPTCCLTWGLTGFLPGLALNCNSPDLCLLSNWDVTCVPLYPALVLPFNCGLCGLLLCFKQSSVHLEQHFKIICAPFIYLCRICSAYLFCHIAGTKHPLNFFINLFFEKFSSLMTLEGLLLILFLILTS